MRGRSNSLIPSLTNALRNVGVTWMCEAIRSTLSKRPPRQAATFIKGPPTSQSRVLGVSTLRRLYKALIATLSAVDNVRWLYLFHCVSKDCPYDNETQQSVCY